MDKSIFFRRRIIAIIILCSLIFSVICIFRGAKTQETIILHEDDKSVLVSKGTKIDGDAVELIYLDNNTVVVEKIETPAVADRIMSVKCAEGENSECILSK